MKGLQSLLPKTESALLLLSQSTFISRFVFVGGSALAVYLNHRKSEDLDFFSPDQELDKGEILNSLSSIFGEGFMLFSESKTQIDCVCNEVKLTFFASGWQILNQNEVLVNNVRIVKKEVLAGMKINTLFLRAKFRDYYDLYAILKDGMSMTDLFSASKQIMPSINRRLFETALIFTDDIEDDEIAHLEPIYKLTKKKISTYFVKLIDEWNRSR